MGTAASDQMLREGMTMGDLPPTRSAWHALGEAVRHERTRLGLSGRTLAVLARVSQPAVSRVEAHGEAAWENVRRLLVALPGIDPRTVLGLPDAGAWPARPDTWSRLACGLGVAASVVSLRVVVSEDGQQECELRVEDLHGHPRRELTAADRLALAGAAAAGSAQLAYRMSDGLLPGTRLELEEDGVAHEVRVSRDGRSLDVASRHLAAAAADSLFRRAEPHGRPYRQGACLPLELPARRVVLRVELGRQAAGRRVRPWAWPAGLAPGPDLPLDAWSALWPDAPRRVVAAPDGSVELRLDRPPPGILVGLGWDPEDGDGALRDGPDGQNGKGGDAPSPVELRPLRPRPVAEVVTSRRCEAGWSCRELSRRAEYAVTTLQRLEQGGGARVGVVRSCLAALRLSPFAVLGTSEKGAPALDARDVSAIWQEQVALYGIVSHEEIRILRVLPGGEHEIESRSVGLDWSHGDPAGVRVRFGLTRAPQGGGATSLESVTTPRASGAEPRVAVVSHGTGPVIHDLRLSGSAPGPATVVRRLRSRSPASTTGHFFFAPSHPTRQLRVLIRFPKDQDVLGASVHALPRACPPVAGVTDLLPRLHPNGVRVESHGRVVRLEIDRPLPLLRYVLHVALA